MKFGDINQLEIRMCWPNPDNVCLEGGCAHCAEGSDARWIPLDEVMVYADKHRVATMGRHGQMGSLYDAFTYGMHHDWHNLPKRKLNVRRARVWHGTLADRIYAGWEHMQREE